MSSRCFVSPRARDQLSTLRAQHHDAVSFSTNDRNGGEEVWLCLRWPSLDACYQPRERKGSPRHHVDEHSLVPRSEQNFRRTHVCEPMLRMRIRRLSAGSSRMLLLQPRQRRPLCMPQCVGWTWFARPTIVRDSAAVGNRRNKPAHQLSPRAAAGAPPPAGSRAAAPSARTVGSSGRLRRRARL
eukprot:SAG31_NODE_2121_length_6404_cov_17.936875_3_plen_184_part_00